MLTAPPGFAIPDFTRPFDHEAELRASPVRPTVKGMFLQGLVDQCKNAGRPLPGRGSYVAFKDYSQAEHVAAMVDAARILHPDVPVREGIRRLAQQSYDTLASTFIGKVIFGVVGRDIHAITRLVSKAYDVSGKGTTATLLEHGDHHSLIALDGSTVAADCWHYGSFEGVLAFCGVEGTVHLKIASPTRAELFTIWKNRP